MNIQNFEGMIEKMESDIYDVYQVVFDDISFDFSLQNYESYKQTEDIDQLRC